METAHRGHRDVGHDEVLGPRGQVQQLAVRTFHRSKQRQHPDRVQVVRHLSCDSIASRHRSGHQQIRRTAPASTSVEGRSTTDANVTNPDIANSLSTGPVSAAHLAQVGLKGLVVGNRVLELGRVIGLRAQVLSKPLVHDLQRPAHLPAQIGN